MLTCCLSLNSYAELKPTQYQEDSRIKYVAFAEHNVVPIYGTPLTTTQLLFGKDEVVLDVEGGDSQGWIVTHQKSLPNMLFIKPTQLDSNSNMTVVTNEHIYYFNVMSIESNAHTYALQFIYPKDEQKRKALKFQQESREQQTLRLYQKSPKKFNGNYDFNGDNRIKPHHVFDDGVFTYIELYPNQDVPAVFAIDNNQGEEAIVNFSRRGNFIIIHRTAPQLTLRMNQHIVGSLFNNRTIGFIKGATHG